LRFEVLALFTHHVFEIDPLLFFITPAVNCPSTQNFTTCSPRVARNIWRELDCAMAALTSKV